MNYLPVLCFLVLLAGVASQADDYEYEYGDADVAYDSVRFDSDTPLETPQPPSAVKSIPVREKERIPLCCPEGQVYDFIRCVTPPEGFGWRPTLNGATDPTYEYMGLPMCDNNREPIQLLQIEVHFSDSDLLLEHYFPVGVIQAKDYCITKVLDNSLEGESETFQTKAFLCINSKTSGVVWLTISIAHVLLILTLLTYFLVSELRSLQGQYMICFLTSLLIYNLCLYPGSAVSMDISDVSCIAIGAVKYFFFCGVFLWFNVICFDTWRTVSNRQDVSGRRRFLIYSGYSWIAGAILTTVVLVMPYTRDGTQQGTRNDPLKESPGQACKLKMQMDLILQFAQGIVMALNFLFLILASCRFCGYDKLGNGLLRCDASLCLKQSWKLFAIMIAHVIRTIDEDLKIVPSLPVPMWQYLLLEASAIFAVFAYRRSLLRLYFLKSSCNRCASPTREAGSHQEKNILTMT